jgi:subtilisin-like proprotein convertase family protein
MKIRDLAGRHRLLACVGMLIPAAALAQITVSDTPVVVDNNYPSYVERSFQVSTQGAVDRVRVTVDFQAVYAPGGPLDVNVCSDPPEGNGWANEIAIRLTSPEGTHVYLVTNRRHPELDATYAGSVAVDHRTPRVEVVFDDQAEAQVGETNRGIPESGTFRPMEPLSTLRGELAAGTWTVGLQDDTHYHPLCYHGATLEIQTTDAQG